jgi:hypothetical protein
MWPDGGAKTELNLRLAEITSKCRNTARELTLSCARGCFAGLGVAFFMSLRLGAPATRQLAGYMVGLFLMAGVKFGFSLWVIRSFVLPHITHFCVPDKR